ncbi:E3 ubiquitin-protein ligase MIB2-like isoform X3 [Argopecten irradians]|uniref:E3 ubiquitin-protein ligase MIB2-like isoform X3 n=1 Tax=Argopecten irradians TaxID=31199 RepID=UPI00371B6FD6
MKWNCRECEDVCLCSVCYIKGRHDERHEFIRYFSPGSIGVKVPKRFISQKQKSLGIFPGATVARGTDWSWAEQDGGAGSPGKVTGLRSYEEGIGDRNSVTVTWEKTQKTANYRVGFEGKVDLKCMVDGEAPGYEYYKEHLPLLDGDILAKYTDTSSSIKVNDMICVGMSREDLKSAQDKHGGWTVRMNDVYDVDIGDIVRVSDDRKFVQTVQQDHGGWVDDMDMVLGKVGKAVRITPKKDVVVAFGRKTWIFHPACLIPDPEGQIFEIDPISSGAQQSAAGLGDILGLMLAQMLLGGGGVRVVGPEDFLQAAARGDDDLIVKILKSNPQLANEVIKGTTALVLASHEGHNTVVRTLRTTVQRETQPDN